MWLSTNWNKNQPCLWDLWPHLRCTCSCRRESSHCLHKLGRPVDLLPHWEGERCPASFGRSCNGSVRNPTSLRLQKLAHFFSGRVCRHMFWEKGRPGGDTSSSVVTPDIFSIEFIPKATPKRYCPNEMFLQNYAPNANMSERKSPNLLGDVRPQWRLWVSQLLISCVPGQEILMWMTGHMLRYCECKDFLWVENALSKRPSVTTFAVLLPTQPSAPNEASGASPPASTQVSLRTQANRLTQQDKVKKASQSSVSLFLEEDKKAMLWKHRELGAPVSSATPLSDLWTVSRRKSVDTHPFRPTHFFLPFKSFCAKRILNPNVSGQLKWTGSPSVWNHKPTNLPTVQLPPQPSPLLQKQVDTKKWILRFAFTIPKQY